MPLLTHLDRWHESARRRGRPLSQILGGPVRLTGEIISDNLRAEAKLAPGALSAVVAAFDEAGPFDEPDPAKPSQTRYDTAMESLARRGGPAEVAGNLARLVNARAIITHDARVFNGSRYPTAAEWDRFRRTMTELLAAEPGIVDAFLAGLQLSRGATCWATERDKIADVERGTGHRDFGRIHDRLGLDWPEVAALRKAGSASREVMAALLQYDSSDVAEVAVPTVADAGWNGLFRPSPKDARIGTTLDRRGGDGLPEVVHKSRDCACLKDRTFSDSGPIRS